MRARALARAVYPLVGVAVILVIWQAYTRVFAVSRIVLPAPSDIMLASIERYDLLLRETWPTFLESVYGFGLAVAIGILAATSRAFSFGAADLSKAVLAQWSVPLIIGLVSWLALAPVAVYLAVSKD